MVFMLRQFDTCLSGTSTLLPNIIALHLIIKRHSNNTIPDKATASLEKQKRRRKRTASFTVEG
jgi:hypothetical protein